MACAAVANNEHNKKPCIFQTPKIVHSGGNNKCQWVTTTLSTTATATATAATTTTTKRRTTAPETSHSLNLWSVFAILRSERVRQSKL